MPISTQCSDNKQNSMMEIRLLASVYRKDYAHGSDRALGAKTETFSPLTLGNPLRPGTYNPMRGEVTEGNSLGRGFSQLAIRQGAMPVGLPLETRVKKAVRADDGRSPDLCVSPTDA
ncbi:hypothetical protein C7271_17720 [filamentous cyanobacterium CCP5]|nr:hypothetical protein C7271_17720 [filamentous cyanobacterium CCP5]